MADLLRMDYINSLPQPFMVTFCGGDEWELDYICVETGCMRIVVCGLSQIADIGMVSFLTDMDGTKHDIDTFYSDYKQQ